MIDPYNITDFNRTESQLEEFWLFCLSVAGKTAKIISKQLDSFLNESDFKAETPFGTIKNMVANNSLLDELKRSRIGKYSLLAKGFQESLELDLKNDSLERLESIRGCGPKTSRFFILHSRRGIENIAVLDTHILSYLRDKGYPVTKGVPTSKVYPIYEKYFLREAARSGMGLADFDLKIWKERAR